MSLEPQSLAALFELSGDAVIAARGRSMVWASPAAEKILGGAVPGADLACLLPEELADDGAERMTAGLRVGGRDMTVYVTRGPDGLTLYLLRPAQEEQPGAAMTAAELGDLLMTQRVALDRLMQSAGARDDPETAELASYLYHSYYRARRLQSHMTLAALPAHDYRFRTDTPVFLDELFGAVCDTTAALAADRGVEIRFEAKDRCMICGSPKLLEILLFNLLENSLLHTPAGGVIRVRVEEAGGFCLLSVDDTGTGIRPERLGGLFSGAREPDLTDPGAGPGYGLQVVRSVAAAHGGTVMAESPEGHGTRIRVTLRRPDPEESLLREPDAYVPGGMDLALTELSVVLDRSKYAEKYLD